MTCQPCAPAMPAGNLLSGSPPAPAARLCRTRVPGDSFQHPSKGSLYCRVLSMRHFEFAERQPMTMSSKPVIATSMRSGLELLLLSLFLCTFLVLAPRRQRGGSSFVGLGGDSSLGVSHPSLPSLSRRSGTGNVARASYPHARRLRLADSRRSGERPREPDRRRVEGWMGAGSDSVRPVGSRGATGRETCIAGRLRQERRTAHCVLSHSGDPFSCSISRSPWRRTRGARVFLCLSQTQALRGQRSNFRHGVDVQVAGGLFSEQSDPADESKWVAYGQGNAPLTFTWRRKTEDHRTTLPLRLRGSLTELVSLGEDSTSIYAEVNLEIGAGRCFRGRGSSCRKRSP